LSIPACPKLTNAEARLLAAVREGRAFAAESAEMVEMNGIGVRVVER
jgi:hypothetical protein